MRKVTFGINISLDGYCGHESAIEVIQFPSRLPTRK